MKVIHLRTVISCVLGMNGIGSFRFSLLCDCVSHLHCLYSVYNHCFVFGFHCVFFEYWSKEQAICN